MFAGSGKSSSRASKDKSYFKRNIKVKSRHNERLKWDFTVPKLLPTTRRKPRLIIFYINAFTLAYINGLYLENTWIGTNILQLKSNASHVTEYRTSSHQRTVPAIGAL